MGAQLATVAQLMHRGDALPIVDHKTPMQDALITMTSKGFGIAVVIQDGALLGVITDGDLRRHMDTLMQATAGDIAGQNPVTVTPDMFAAEALNIMNTKKSVCYWRLIKTTCPLASFISTIYCAQVLHENRYHYSRTLCLNPVSRETNGGTDPA